jgi:HEAT repeat protein
MKVSTSHAVRSVLLALLLTACVGLGWAEAQAGNAPSLNTNPASTLARHAQELTSPNPVRAAAAAYWLGRHASSAASVVPQLAAILGDSRPVDPTLYREEPAAVLPKHSSPGQEAAAALAQIGRPAVDALIRTLRSSASAFARQNAAWALGQIEENKAAGVTL